MGLNAIQPVFGVSNKGRLKLVSSATGTSQKMKSSGSKLRYDTFQKANNKGNDESARMQRQGFLMSRPICDHAYMS